MTVKYITTDNREVARIEDADYQPQRGDTVTFPIEQETTTALISHVNAQPTRSPTVVFATLNRSQQELTPSLKG